MDGATTATSILLSGLMVFEPILEEGVFRFDCSAYHRAKAYPSLSFADQTVRETPIEVPEFVPRFRCCYGEQMVKIKMTFPTLRFRGKIAYKVVRRDLKQSEQESIFMEGNIGGGLVIQRHISSLKNNPKILQFDSSIFAQSHGAGSGGFSRLVCLKVHPKFTLLNPTEVAVFFKSIDGSSHEIWPDTEEQSFEGTLRPNGEWMLVDKCAGVSLINRFDPSELSKCVVHWRPGTVSLELWSELRPVSVEKPLRILYSYEVIRASS